jgi:hypothetical protein
MAVEQSDDDHTPRLDEIDEPASANDEFPKSGGLGVGYPVAPMGEASEGLGRVKSQLARLPVYDAESLAMNSTAASKSSTAGSDETILKATLRGGF